MTRSYVISASRAGLQSAAVVDGQSGDAFVLDGGAVLDSTTSAPTAANSYAVSASRAGVGSAVIGDSANGLTTMLADVGAEYDPSGAVGLTLTGVPATAGVGSFTTSIQITVSGVTGTGQAGSIVISDDTNVSISGVATTSGIGTFVAEIDKTITGVSATSHVGTIAVRVPSKGFFHAFP